VPFFNLFDKLFYCKSSSGKGLKSGTAWADTVDYYMKLSR